MVARCTVRRSTSSPGRVVGIDASFRTHLLRETVSSTVLPAWSLRRQRGRLSASSRRLRKWARPLILGRGERKR